MPNPALGRIASSDPRRPRWLLGFGAKKKIACLGAQPPLRRIFLLLAWSLGAAAVQLQLNPDSSNTTFHTAFYYGTAIPVLPPTAAFAESLFTGSVLTVQVTLSPTTSTLFEKLSLSAQGLLLFSLRPILP